MLSAAIEGMFLNSELFDHQRGASNKGYKKIDMGTLVLSTQNLHLGNANVNLRFEHGMVSPAYKTYHIHDCSIELIAEWVKSEKAKRFFYDATTVGASVCRRNVEWDTLYDQPLYLPSVAEQERLAIFLTSLSARIKKQSELVENLKKYKRGLLYAIFSRKLTFGYFDEWQEKTIAECLQYEQPQKYIVKSEQYEDSYSIPVLTANKAFILGYTNETHGIYKKGDVVIYDDFTMDMKYVRFPFKVKSSTIKMLTPRQGFDLYFVYALLQSLELQPEGHQRSYISKVEPMIVKVPCYEEQVKISNFLQQCDFRVHQEEENLTKLLQYKNGLLQALFI